MVKIPFRSSPNKNKLYWNIKRPNFNFRKFTLNFICRVLDVSIIEYQKLFKNFEKTNSEVILFQHRIKKIIKILKEMTKLLKVSDGNSIIVIT